MSDKISDKEKRDLIYLWLLKHAHEKSSTITMMKSWTLEPQKYI